jgi:hypothetical protein
MSGFETIVRPAVFPNIRPALPRVLAAEDSPEKGICTINGGAPQKLGSSSSWSVSLSRQLPHKEVARQFDTERVYQVDSKTGVMHQDNYVEIERLKRVRMDYDQGSYKMLYNDPPPRDNVKVLLVDETRRSSS